MPADSAAARATEPIVVISDRALRARAACRRWATIFPVRSATAARTYSRPTSIPTTHPAAGFNS